MRAHSAGDWLAEIIREWRPDIIHTLGIHDRQGGEFYFKTRQACGLEGVGKWVLQLRGGSDLMLRRHDPVLAPSLAQMMNSADQILSDNLINLEYAHDLGIARSKFASIVPVPGTGGVDIEQLAGACKVPPSARRIILWPKSYESMWSKAIPVLEALQLAWESIQPCEVYLLGANAETTAFFYALPESIRSRCNLSGRLPRQEALQLFAQARVVLAPALVDGVPNVLYEAMASGALPIVSPLETLKAVVQHEENVLFARNLYPEEIAAALKRAMTDDILVERASQNNRRKVVELADRRAIREKVLGFYDSLCSN